MCSHTIFNIVLRGVGADIYRHILTLYWHILTSTQLYKENYRLWKCTTLHTGSSCSLNSNLESKHISKRSSHLISWIVHRNIWKKTSFLGKLEEKRHAYSSCIILANKCWKSNFVYNYSQEINLSSLFFSPSTKWKEKRNLKFKNIYFETNESFE